MHQCWSLLSQKYSMRTQNWHEAQKYIYYLKKTQFSPDFFETWSKLPPVILTKSQRNWVKIIAYFWATCKILGSHTVFYFIFFLPAKPGLHCKRHTNSKDLNICKSDIFAQPPIIVDSITEVSKINFYDGRNLGIAKNGVRSPYNNAFLN